MNDLNCEYIRDVYPDVLNGSADASLATAVRAHIASCPECSAEAELIAQLHVDRVAVPRGLPERILAVVADAPRVRRFAPRHLAYAATVAVALLGGTLLLDSTRGPDAPPVAEQPTGGLGVFTVEAAMVSGTGSLQDLTVEELEQLLGEIES